MNNNADYRKYAVLYVDDEAQSLKYMGKAMQADVEVLTATSVAEAEKVLASAADRIAVVISDQRMPGETGVELLTRVRAAHPHIVRILTTAYSDLDSAIDAVNSGAIFRYITKPWDIRELRGTLLRAIDYHIAQKERDILLREKLSVLQRMLIIDRVRSFTVLSMGLASRLRNSMNALKVFLDHAPMEATQPAEDSSVAWSDVWGLAQQESRRVLTAVQDVVEQTAGRDYTFNDEVPVAQLVEQALAEAGTDGKISFTSAEGLAPVRCEWPMLGRMLRTLIDRVRHLTPAGAGVQITASAVDDVWGTPGVRLNITSQGPAWSPKQMLQLFTAVMPAAQRAGDHESDLLLAFFITYHHGGNLVVHPGGEASAQPGIEVRLPFDPRATPDLPLEDDWLERMFVHCDGWSSLGGD